MDIKQIRAFLAICEHNSMTRAAQSLYTSQQALSSTISSLEAELNNRLFRRTHKGMTLTEAGECLRELMEPVVRDFDEALAAFEYRYNATSGDIRLALAPGILRSIAPDLLLSFQDAYPDIHVRLIEAFDTECPQKVISGEADLALTPQTFGEENYKYVNLKTEPLYAIIRRSHPMAGRSSVSMLDLKEEQFVSLDETHRIYQCTMRTCAAYGFTPTFRQLSKDVGFLLSLVRKKDCVFICVGHVLNELAHDYIALPLDDPEMVWHIGGVFKSNEKPSQIVKCFFEFVQDVVDIQLT